MKFYTLKLFIKEKANETGKQDNKPVIDDDDCIEFPMDEDEFLLGPNEDVPENKLFETVQLYNEKLLGKECYIAMDSNFDSGKFTICIKENVNIDEFVNKFLKDCNITDSIESLKEVRYFDFFNTFQRMCRKMNLNDTSIVSQLGIVQLYEDRYYMRNDCIDDRVVDEDKSKERIYSDIEDDNLGIKFKEEIDRIYDCKINKFVGHPAHYIITSKNGKYRRLVTRDLIEALYQKNRLLSRRYTMIFLNGRYIDNQFIEDIYTLNRGGTVYLKVEPNGDSGEISFKSNNIDKILDIAKSHCDTTLTIFAIDGASNEIMDKIQTAFGGMTVVKLYEDIYYKETACDVIRKLARRDELDAPTDIINKLMASNNNYNLADLKSIYSKWHHDYLSTTIFTNYKDYVVHEEVVEEKKSEAYSQLESMIGLGNVKKIINNIINYFSVQKELNSRGIPFKRPAMHMVFTSNPGCGKTTVARLLGQILYDKGILSQGKMFEVGRANLIGEYVGHTAPKVKAAFEKAKGSVLFIDEAYSLLDDKKGLFGDEAINTIVQEMENNRDDLMVIFAGYKKEMEEFVERNPGLNSRIAFHVDFDDYTPDELYNIINSIAKDAGYLIDSKAKDKLLKIFENASKDKTFGNGRFARNLFEKAKMHQTSRIIVKDLKYLSNEELLTLNEEDFEYEFDEEPSKVFGFVA